MATTQNRLHHTNSNSKRLNVITTITSRGSKFHSNTGCGRKQKTRKWDKDRGRRGREGITLKIHQQITIKRGSHSTSRWAPNRVDDGNKQQTKSIGPLLLGLHGIRHNKSQSQRVVVDKSPSFGNWPQPMERTAKLGKFANLHKVKESSHAVDGGEF